MTKAKTEAEAEIGKIRSGKLVLGNLVPLADLWVIDSLKALDASSGPKATP